MSGITIFRYLSVRTLLAKMFGFITAKLAGMSLGRDGPFVHMSTCVAQKLAKLSWFSDIDKNQALKKTMFASAVAAGMTVTFGAPMGAVMFSIEVSSTYYMVSNLFKGFFCATFAIIMFNLEEKLGWLDLYTRTSF